MHREPVLVGSKRKKHPELKNIYYETESGLLVLSTYHLFHENLVNKFGLYYDLVNTYDEFCRMEGIYKTREILRDMQEEIGSSILEIITISEGYTEPKGRYPPDTDDFINSATLGLLLGFMGKKVNENPIKDNKKLFSYWKTLYFVHEEFWNKLIQKKEFDLVPPKVIELGLRYIT